MKSNKNRQVVANKDDFERLVYLAGIAAEYIYDFAPDFSVFYDEAMCDGESLANEIKELVKL